MKTKREFNKSLLLQKIVAQLTADLEVLERAAQASHAEATHESSKAENKYDTRGMEAAYLAGGQAKQAKEIVDSINEYGVLKVKEFETSDPIEMTALVEVETEGVVGTYFIGPRH